MMENEPELNPVTELWCICDIRLWIPVMFKINGHV